MISTRGERPFRPAFLREHYVRSFLQSLYVTLVGSDANTKLLLNTEIRNVDLGLAAGNKLVQSCLRGAVYWLRLAQEFSLSHEMYAAYWLEPARGAARFLESAREATPRSTSIRALVTSQSQPFFDKYFDEQICTLTLVAPDLESAFSLRSRFHDVENIAVGECELDGVQPIPFVNRLHPTALFALRDFHREVSVNLSDLHFMKTSLTDIDFIRRSLTFDNLCEIESVQTKSRRLGRLCVVTGLILTIMPPMLTVLSCIDPRSSIDMVIRPELVSMSIGGLHFLKKFAGTYVRILCIVWYSTPSTPEALIIEEVDEASARNDDEIGFVRIRCRVPLEDLEKRYGAVRPATAPNYVENSAYANWKVNISCAAGVSGMFASAQQHVHNLRQSAEKGENILLGQPELVIDLAKLRISSIARSILRDRTMYEGLLSLVSGADPEGFLADSLKSVKRTSADTDPQFADRLWWLTGLGLLGSGPKGAFISRVGYDVAYRAAQDSIDGLVQKRETLDLISLSADSRIPTLLFICHMKALKGFSPVSIEGHACDLFWIRNDCANAELKAQQFAKCLTELADLVLETMGAVHYGLAAPKIEELLKREHGSPLGRQALYSILEWLKACGKIHSSEGKLWIYPWENRILRLLSSERRSAFTIDEIQARLGLPATERPSVKELLEKLAIPNSIMQVGSEMWAYPSTDMLTRSAVMTNALKHKSRRLARKILAGRGHVQLEWIMAQLRMGIREDLQAHGAEFGLDAWKAQDIARESVSEMISNGELIEKKGRFRLI